MKGANQILDVRDHRLELLNYLAIAPQLQM